jgi:hypothetical protein
MCSKHLDGTCGHGTREWANKDGGVKYFYYKSFGVALGCGLVDRHSRSDSRQGMRIFFFTTLFRTNLGPTQPPIQWVTGAFPLGVKWPRREADHSRPSSAEVKNAWSYTSTPPIRLHGVVLS